MIIPWLAGLSAERSDVPSRTSSLSGEGDVLRTFLASQEAVDIVAELEGVV